MITSISIANVATFHPTIPVVLDDLRPLNYIFGSNGTGKTTISRVIANSTSNVNCQCTWKNARELEALVLNDDFVKNNFSQLRGVFTLGEKEMGTEKRISELKAELDKERGGLSTLNRSLEGEDGSGGKKGELAKLEDDSRDKFWKPVQKIKQSGKLVDALKGFLSNKDTCKHKILDESSRNKATLHELANLEERAQTVFGREPTKEPELPTFDHSKLTAHEANPILKKKVIGKEDVQIAAMIKKLGNSDWVRQGKPYYEKNDHVCPFCQQTTTEDFAQSLEDYFDEAFENDSKEIETLISQYATDASTIESTLKAILDAPGRFLDVETMKAKKTAFDRTFDANKLLLENKRKEPSQIVALQSLESVLAEIGKCVDSANAKVAEHNNTVDNLAVEKKKLTDEVWRFLLNELDVNIKQYKRDKEVLDKAIAGITENINKTNGRIQAKQREIRELEQQTTSIQPTISAINVTLKQFGFDSFELADEGDGRHYKLVRKDGTDARQTLSEGERTFVVFLYFYHLLQGSLSDTGTTTDRVVVFDDPVSSLDSDVLFIVSTLIKEVIERCRAGTSSIKQVFVMTHNVYFHKEVTYNSKRPKDGILSNESFWMVRKSSQQSQVEQCKQNPIKTSYELLWMDVREAMNGGTANVRIENTLRRILEYYFTVFGSLDRDDICAKFEGQDKSVCYALFSWINAGSHHALDDAHVSPSDTMTRSYLRVFKEVFKKMGHKEHCDMMLGSSVVGDVEDADSLE